MFWALDRCCEARALSVSGKRTRGGEGHAEVRPQRSLGFQSRSPEGAGGLSCLWFPFASKGEEMSRWRGLGPSLGLTW